jgi:hypothetical protein
MSPTFALVTAGIALESCYVQPIVRTDPIFFIGQHSLKCAAHSWHGHFLQTTVRACVFTSRLPSLAYMQTMRHIIGPCMLDKLC